MKFALYHPWVYLTGGIERVLLELLRRSQHEWTLYTHHFESDATYPELSDFEVVELSPRVSVQRSFLPLVEAAATIARTKLPEDGRDGLLVSSEGLGDFIVARETGPVVCYCHTPLKILHDQPTRDHLREHAMHKYAALRLLAPAFSAADRAAWQGYSHVFSNSRMTRERIAAARLRPASDVEVLEAGVDTSRITPGKARREMQFLVAGRIMWQKNIELAIDAVRILARQGVRAPLVIAGAVDRKSVDYLEQLRQRAAGLPVRFVIRPTDSELIELYRTSHAVLFTPRSEDFGIVPLEAMAAGTPVLAVNAGGPRETVVDGVTGWLLDATPEAFAAKMRELTSESLDMAFFRAAARRQATHFGWDRMIDRIDAVMAEVAAEGARDVTSRRLASVDSATEIAAASPQ
jgi:glycosyltransferase involved in cell wall biosynthesis